MNDSKEVVSRYIFFLICGIFYPLVFVLSVVSLLWRRYVQRPKYKIQKGDVAVITGAGHGLGKGYAHYLAERGCTICVVDINGKMAEEVALELRQKYHVKAKAYVTDVGKFEEVDKLQKQVKEDFGNTTILINNAGMLLLSNILDPKPEEMLNMINVNLAAHLWTTKVFLPDMKAQNKGHILAVSSVAGKALFGLMFGEVYTSTKFAVRGYMNALRKALIFCNYSNITCTTVCPYFLNTNLNVNELFKLLRLHLLYPTVESEVIVKSSIEAMLRGEHEVIIPNLFAGLYKLSELLPSESSTFLQMVLYKLVTSPREITEFYADIFKPQMVK